MQNIIGPPLLVIVGPTACGKSRLAMKLAVELGAEIVSADSRAIYRGMDIGTAKPSPEERRRITHHMIDLIEPDQAFNVGDYKRQVEALLAGTGKSGRVLILAGGTGLYVKAVLYGLWDGPPADPHMRSEFAAREQKSPGALYRELVEADSLSATRIHRNDLPKIIRALEVFHLTGTPLSSFHSRHKFEEQRRRFLMIGLKTDRRELYRRIDERVEEMIQEGWIAEVEQLLRAGFHEDLPSMLSLGYRTISQLLKGKLSLEQARESIKQETRNYAKRQLTWFNKDPHVEWVEWDGGNRLIEDLKRRVEMFCVQT